MVVYCVHNTLHIQLGWYITTQQVPCLLHLMALWILETKTRHCSTKMQWPVELYKSSASHLQANKTTHEILL